jgi:hypothetical protein
MNECMYVCIYSMIHLKLYPCSIKAETLTHASQHKVNRTEACIQNNGGQFLHLL